MRYKLGLSGQKVMIIFTILKMFIIIIILITGDFLNVKCMFAIFNND